MLSIAALREDLPPTQASFQRLNLDRLVKEWDDIIRGAEFAVTFLDTERIFDAERLLTVGAVYTLAAVHDCVPKALDPCGNAKTVLRKYLWRALPTLCRRHSALRAGYPDSEERTSFHTRDDSRRQYPWSSSDNGQQPLGGFGNRGTRIFPLVRYAVREHTRGKQNISPLTAHIDAGQQVGPALYYYVVRILKVIVNTVVGGDCSKCFGQRNVLGRGPYCSSKSASVALPVMSCKRLQLLSTSRHTVTFSTTQAKSRIGSCNIVLGICAISKAR